MTRVKVQLVIRLLRRFELNGRNVVLVVIQTSIAQLPMLVVHQSADVLAGDDLLEVAHDVHVEDVDGEVVLHAHGGGGDVHYLQPLGNDILIGDVLELGGGGVLLGVGGVDAVHTGSLQHHVGLYLYATQGRTRVGGKVRRTCAGTHDDFLAAFHGLAGLPLGVELADRLHADGGKHAVLLPDCTKGTAQCQGVDNRGTHTHLVALHAVKTLACSGKATEDVASTYDNAYLHPHFGNFLDLAGIVVETLGVDALFLLTGQAFAGEFQ